MDLIYSNALTAIAIASLTWFIKGLYDKYWQIRPRLYVSISNPLFSQKNINYQSYLFGWRQTIRIKNNSKFSAYNIELHFPDGFNLSDKRNISDFFEKNNHLDCNQKKDFEVESTLELPFERHARFKINSDGSRTFLPGVKNENPQVSLMPEKVKKIKLYLKYENEKGVVFYTQFSKENEKEVNRLIKFKPKL